MANSHESYEDRIGKYKAGDTLIQGYGDYAPTNVLITKVANTAFILSVDNANLNVGTREQTLKTKQIDRIAMIK